MMVRKMCHEKVLYSDIFWTLFGFFTSIPSSLFMVLIVRCAMNLLWNAMQINMLLVNRNVLQFGMYHTVVNEYIARSVWANMNPLNVQIVLYSWMDFFIYKLDKRKMVIKIKHGHNLPFIHSIFESMWSLCILINSQVVKLFKWKWSFNVCKYLIFVQTDYYIENKTKKKEK